MEQAVLHIYRMKMKKAAAAWWPCLVLLCVNVFTFREHYAGAATFPWDFLGGYHTQAFGWYDNGGVFSPPQWFPWTNLGFPAFLALQSSAWYLPLILMHALGLPYTIHAATVLQVMHVLLGATGVYCLIRRVGGGQAVALIAALGYHFSVTFYANQEHVDIIRAAAWFPWLLYLLHPAGFHQSRRNIFVTAVVLSQFLICAYPGNIVSAVYACVVWVALWSLDQTTRAGVKSYLIDLFLAVLSGTLMAMPKWLPLILNGSAGLKLAHYPPSAFDGINFLTLLSPYDVPALPGDVTMRSIWLPLTCVWGVCYANFRLTHTRIGLAFVGLAIFMGTMLPRLHHLSEFFPGIGISRVPLSDWRPVLQMGLILICADGWTNLFAQKISSGKAIRAATLFLAGGFGLTCVAYRYGFQPNSLVRMLLALVVLMLVTVWYSTIGFQRVGRYKLQYVMMLFLIGATIFDGYQYQVSQPRTWILDWNKQVEKSVFGEDVSSMIRHPAPILDLVRRPGRLLVGAGKLDALAHQNSSLYNKCWYGHSYCVFGYDSMKLSASHEMFLAAVAGGGGDALLRFVSRPQTLLALEPDIPQLVPATVEPDTSPVIGDSGAVKVEFERYSGSFVQFRISATRAIQIVENEIWWPGWTLQICSAVRCEQDAHIRSTPQGLRTWSLEKGSWVVKLKFAGPSMIPGLICALFGFILSIAGCYLRSASVSAPAPVEPKR